MFQVVWTHTPRMGCQVGALEGVEEVVQLAPGLGSWSAWVQVLVLAQVNGGWSLSSWGTQLL